MSIHIGMGEEVTWGTAVTRTQFHRAYAGSRIGHNAPRDPSSLLLNRDPDTLFEGVERGEGDFEIALPYGPLKSMLVRHCMGTVAADAGADPYQHTHGVDAQPFTRASSPLVGLTMEINAELPESGFEAWLLEGGRVTRFGQRFEPGTENPFRFSVAGERAYLGAKSGSPTFPDLDTLMVKPSAITIEIDTVSTSLYAVEYEVDNGLNVDDAYLGSSYIAPPLPEGKRSITGTIRGEWANKTLYNKFISGATASLVITATGSGDYYEEWRFNTIRYREGGEPELVEGDKRRFEIPWTAYDDATYTAMQWEWQDNTAAAA